MSKKLSFWLSITPFIISALLTLVILLFFRYLPQKMPLFYSLPWGEGQLAARMQFLILPSIIVLVTMLNFTVSLQLHDSQNFFKKMLGISSFLASAILTAAFVKIVFLFV